MRRPGMLVVGVCVVVLVIVGGKADLGDEEVRVGVVKKKGNVQLSKDECGRELGQEIRVLQRTADDPRDVRGISVRTGVDEFKKKIKGYQTYFQRLLQKGTEFRQMQASKEDFNKIQLKEDGPKKLKGQSCKRYGKDIYHKKEDTNEFRIKREAGKDYRKEKDKSKCRKFHQLQARKKDFSKIQRKNKGLKTIKNNTVNLKETSQRIVKCNKTNFKKEDTKSGRIKRSPDYQKENVKSIVITKEVKAAYPVRVTKLVPRPVLVEVERPVAVGVPRPVPVRVERVVRYPVRVERVPAPYPVVKEVPVFVRRHVVRPRPVRVVKPYPVIVERRVPVPVVRKVLHPVRIPVRVPVPVLQPLVRYVLYPVHKTVLYPVKVPVPVRKKPRPVVAEKKVPYAVYKPVPVGVKSNNGYQTRHTHGLGSEDSYDYAR